MNGLPMLPSFLTPAVARAARAIPFRSPLACMGGTILFLFGGIWLVPRIGRHAAKTPVLGMLLRHNAAAATGLQALTAALVAAAFLGAGLFQARCLLLCFPDTLDSGPSVRGRRPRRAPMALAGLAIAEEDLMTSLLVTGVTGSSKTAGILLPALSQLLGAYRGDKGREALGAFIPEVKGDLVDAAVYLAHESGRCVCRDVIILSPSCRIPVVRYRDERGRRWFLSGRGGSGGSDAGDLLPPLTFPSGHRASGRRAPRDVFEEPEDCLAVLPEWRRHTLALDRLEPRFVGWRWRGGRLVRIARTYRRDEPEPALGPRGAPIWADPPRTLTADQVEYVDSGVHYNLLDPRIAPAEAAERLTRIIAMSRGHLSHGENDYFYEQGRKLMAACLSLHRAIAPEAATAADVVALATREERLDLALAALDQLIAKTERSAGSPVPDFAAQARARRLPALRELAAFFHGEWKRMIADGKTANVIKSTLSAALDPFLHDPNLSETFCRPSTFSFEACAQDGRIIAFVPGDRYEQLGRLLGTACKMDFQSVMLARTSRPDLNRTRLVLYFADECHKYAAGGSAAAGDPYFMNLSRSNRVANICATQSYAWLVEVLGREAANVYISAFGVQFWLQQTDPETCRRAAEICGTVTRERYRTEHDFGVAGLLAALGSGRDMAIRRRSEEEESPRFRPEDFVLLDVGEVIGYNKGRPGRFGKVSRGWVSYLKATRPPAGPAAIRARMREYYRELLENLADERGESARWDAEPSAEECEETRRRAEFQQYVNCASTGSESEAEWAVESGVAES